MISFNSQKKLLNKLIRSHKNRLTVTGISNKVDWLLIVFVGAILLIVMSIHSYSTYKEATSIEAIVDENSVPVKRSEEINVEGLEKVIEKFEIKEGVFEGL